MYSLINLLIFATLPFFVCFSESVFISISPHQNILSKIRFNLSIISDEGLIGSSNNLRSLDYEFCLPANPFYLSTVQQIDPTIQVYPNSPGRIGCYSHQYLCIGNTHKPNWRAIIIRIASLPYIKKIEQSFAE